MFQFKVDVLLLLSNEAFAIWPKTPSAPTPIPEEKLVQVTMARAKSHERVDLILDKVDEQTIRIVRVMEDARSHSREKTINHFDISNDAFIPMYTITANPKVEWNIKMGYYKDKGSQAYPLLTRYEAFQLQQALVKYKECHFSEDVYMHSGLEKGPTEIEHDKKNDSIF